MMAVQSMVVHFPLPSTSDMITMQTALYFIETVFLSNYLMINWVVLNNLSGCIFLAV